MEIDQNRPILVIAGSQDQMNHWIRKNIQYVTRAEQIDGIGDFNFIRIGTWYENNHIELDEILMSNKRTDKQSCPKCASHEINYSYLNKDNWCGMCNHRWEN